MASRLTSAKKAASPVGTTDTHRTARRQTANLRAVGSVMPAQFSRSPSVDVGAMADGFGAVVRWRNSLARAAMSSVAAPGAGAASWNGAAGAGGATARAAGAVGAAAGGRDGTGR